MPSRNTIREFSANEYYHVYNRGVEKRDIFIDDNDYVVFLSLLKRYLSREVESKINRHKFKSLSGQVELLTYCLMPNHYHLLFYQTIDTGITELMRRLTTSYVMYFNNKYHRVGSLFQSRYKASSVNGDAYLHHISRYVHLNPDNYINYPYSSIRYYLGASDAPSWINTDKVLSLFGSKEEYRQFLDEYIDTKYELNSIKWQLANDIE